MRATKTICLLLSAAAAGAMAGEPSEGLTEIVASVRTEGSPSDAAAGRIVRHSPIPATLEERIQSLQTAGDDLILERAALINIPAFFASIDDAFKNDPVPQSKKIAGQVGQVAAELLGSSYIDPLEVALLNPPSHPLDETFKSAAAAYRAKDSKKLEELLPLFENYPLCGYIEYWIIKLKLEEAPDDALVNMNYMQFINRRDGEYLADLARYDYLKAAAQYLSLASFMEIYSQMKLRRNDPELLAWKLIYEYQNLESPEDKSRLVFKAKELYKDGPASSRAFKELSKIIESEDAEWTWHKIIILTQNKEYALAKTAAAEAREKDLPASVDEISALLDNPLSTVNSRKGDLSNDDPRFAVLVVLRLARHQPALAADAARTFDYKLSTFWKSLIWSYIGYVGIANQAPESEDWFDNADSRALLLRPQLVVDIKPLFEWKARAILRNENWSKLAAFIETMPDQIKESELWTYWLGFSLLKTGRAEAAGIVLDKISSNATFYGKLACDALGKKYPIPKNSFKAEKSKVDEWASNPSLMRARALYRLHMYIDGHREWNWAARGLRPEEFITLAEYAKNKLLIHRMINTSLNSGKEVVSIEQRFPMPHFSLIKQVCDAQNMPFTWIYGLIRQESRFMTGVNSSAGAQGLMQIMPATAKWVADKLGFVGFKLSSLTELEMNIILGSAYLNLLYSDLDSSYVLATAAYNAGPLRARIWRATIAEEVPAAVFIETIPFYETRNYVKNVLSNMHTYSLRTSEPIKNFTEFLGVIRPSSELESELP